MLNPGLYEQEINQKLDSELSAIPEACRSTAPIDKADPLQMTLTPFDDYIWAMEHLKKRI